MKIKISWLNKVTQLVLTLLLFVFISISYYSQDGEKLFKANCASCHNPIKNATGPKLQGVKDKWIKAGEGELMYEWVKNPAGLYGSGKSKQAKAIWNYSPTAMTAQGHLSNDEIDAVFAYIDAYTAPVKDVSNDVVQTSGSNDEGSSLIWWVVAGVLILIIITVSGIKRQLSYALAEKEGNPKDPNIPLAKHVQSWMVRNWFVFMLLLVSVLIMSGVELANRAFQVGVFDDYQPSQTIAYSHKLHAGDMGIDCKYCHHSAVKSKHAGIPSLNVCMNCHKTVHEGTVTGKEEIAKIHDHVGYNVSKQDYNKDSDGNRIEKPMVWNKAHNLPDHVFFSHQQHVHENTGNIDCRQCHGPVETYTLGRISSTEEINAYAETDEGAEKGIVQLTKPILTMGWCIECHNKKEIDLTSTGYYEEIHNRLKNNPTAMSKILKDKKVTVKELGGWECAKCHY
jgi:cytochrome c2